MFDTPESKDRLASTRTHLQVALDLAQQEGVANALV